MKTITYTETHCADCQFHKAILWKHVRVGKNTYHHYCQHPQSLTDSERSFLSNMSGRWIGEKDIVPDWCPLLPQNKEEGR